MDIFFAFLVNSISSFLGGLISNQLFSKPKIKVFTEKFKVQDKYNEELKQELFEVKEVQRGLQNQLTQESDRISDSKKHLHALEDSVHQIRETELVELHRAIILVTKENAEIKKENETVLSEVKKMNENMNRLINLELDKIERERKKEDEYKKLENQIEKIIKALGEK